MIKIFKGDDTDFLGRTIRITFGTDEIDLTGCTAELSFGGIIKRMPCEKRCDFLLVLSAEETSQLQLGMHNATIRLYDCDGRRFTLSNTLRIFVTDCVRLAYGSNVAVGEITVNLPKILTGETFDVGGTNGDTRNFLAKLAASLGATVVNSEVDHE